uniref:Uncharacterized protein n=1 Tax=Leersia perrieri TaxID=77586 RepID=A0A0D9W843_9ORYZ
MPSVRRFRFKIVVEDDLAGDGFTEEDLEAADQLMQLSGRGARQEDEDRSSLQEDNAEMMAEQDDDDDDDDWGTRDRKRKRPRFRSLSELLEVKDGGSRRGFGELGI